jgi:DNA gyrase subunit A
VKAPRWAGQPPIGVMETDLGVSVNIEEEMRQSYMDYAMSVIIGRALPDVRDGLKPVQRRVLYAMLSEGLLSNRKTSKCAGVVGEVLKRFHPHGDTSVYDALVRLAQDWAMRYRLVEGQGNFGSIDGDPPAAYRYTECRLTAPAELLLRDIDKDTIDLTPNFDDSTMEPLVVPSVWPNLVVNGADGIAVGMATHIPPHNLGEVVDGTIALIENPEIGLHELMRHIPGPDFPTGGIIHGVKPIEAAYELGRGIVKVSGKTHTETLKSKSRETEAIVITEIPFQVNKARLVERIAELVNDKSIDGITRLRDESDRTGMRIVIELKRDATLDIVLNQLYKMTPLQTSFGVINLAIVEGRPVVCSLKQLLTHFINHRRDVVTRRTQYLLKKALERMHLLEGFRIALLNLDEVIQLIKQSDTPQIASAALIGKYGLSAIQAQAILDLRLQKLTGMERLAVEQEHRDLASDIDRFRGILADVRKIDVLIVDELKEVKEKFGDARRTVIEQGEVGALEIEDLIEDEDMVVTVSHKGYAKRTSTSSYREQRRGGKGVAGAGTLEDDFVEHLFIASTHSDLLIFTTLGRLYWLKVYDIPEAGRAARGRALVNLLRLREEEGIAAILPVRDFRPELHIVMVTKQGYIKKTGLMEFNRPRRGGIIACTLNEGDVMIGAYLTGGAHDVVIATKQGMAIRFSESDVRPMGRSARGVIGMRLDAGDEVVGMAVALSAAEGGDAEADRTLLSVCENGYGKRSLLSDYRLQHRAGRGVIDIQTHERNGAVVGVCAVDDSSGLMLITSAGKVIRTQAGGVSVIGRNTKGVRLIDLEPGEKVLAVAPLVESESGQEEE